MKLIVNADDFGYDPGINGGIVHAFQNGIVTSTTLMANQPYTGEAAELALQNPKLGVGLHVNLTRGEPISPAGEVRGLLNEAGFFMEPDHFYQQDIKEEEVSREIQAQLDRIHELKIKPTHMDAHHHLQFHPVVLEVLIKMANEYGIPLRHVDHNTLTRFRKENIPTPDIFVEEFFGEGATLDNLIFMLTEINKRSPGGTVEVMCHPGFMNDFSAESSYRDSRRKELEILCSPEIKNVIHRLDIQLISYNNLKRNF